MKEGEFIKVDPKDGRFLLCRIQWSPEGPVNEKSFKSRQYVTFNEEVRPSDKSPSFRLTINGMDPIKPLERDPRWVEIARAKEAAKNAAKPGW